MYLKEMFNGEIISYFKKKIEKIVLLQVKDLIQMIVRFMTEKIYLHISLSSTKHPFEGHDILCTKYCVAILWKGKNWKFMVPRRKINWHILQIAKSHFILDFVRDFWKLITYDSTENMFLHLGGARMYQKVSASKAYNKNCVPEFPVLSALKNYLVYLQFL